MGEPSAAGAANTNWVSVPVPDHLVDQVQVFVLHLGLRGTAYAWDQDAMAEHLGRLGERGHRLVTLVAESMLEGAPLTAAAVADRLDMNLHEVFGIMHLANDVAGGIARPDLIWTPLAPGGASAPERVLMMIEPLVTLVLAIDRGTNSAESVKAW